MSSRRSSRRLQRNQQCGSGFLFYSFMAQERNTEPGLLETFTTGLMAEWPDAAASNCFSARSRSIWATQKEWGSSFPLASLISLANRSINPALSINPNLME
jgi:hypothetical protein